ncbi:MAG: PhzF family phenazine biosynthesis protein [bacterium]|nr:PhzF family phenazine biosynthesis protein [bacterium]
MELKIYQIDAFTGNVFGGNSAAVCPLDSWIPDSVMQAIAEENNLSETAFFVLDNDKYHIRWFTPKQEAQLCGHATLAAAFVIFNEPGNQCRAIHFESNSGPLHVTREGSLIEMDFPVFHMTPCDKPPKVLLNGIGKHPQEIYMVEDDPNYYAIFESENDVRTIEPDLALLERLHPYGVVVSAPGNRFDCVSRYFAPLFKFRRFPGIMIS